MRAGAKHVIGVDMSTIIEKAKEIVATNGMTNKITLLQGKMEEVELPFPKVDIIISEWMGYFCSTRACSIPCSTPGTNTFRPAVSSFPTRLPCSWPASRTGNTRTRRSDVSCKRADAQRIHTCAYNYPVWDNVWGFDFTPLKRTALAEPLVDTVEVRAVVTDPVAILTLDLYTVQPADLTFAAPFSLPVRRNDFVHALIAWFDIEFTACHKPIRFSTGPHAKYTHWKQTVFYLNDVLTVEEGERVTGVLNCRPSEKNRRDLDIAITWAHETEDPQRRTSGLSEYKMC